MIVSGHVPPPLAHLRHMITPAAKKAGKCSLSLGSHVSRKPGRMDFGETTNKSVTVCSSQCLAHNKCLKRDAVIFLNRF